MQNSKVYGTILVFVILSGFLGLSTALSSLMKSVTISSSGKILARVLFDSCDQTSYWNIYHARDPQCPGYNTIEVDTVNKIERTGSLKGTFAATAPNYGGQFYKSNGTFWNWTALPLLRMWMKINQTMYSAFRLEIVCSYSFDVFGYEILDQLTVGEWCEVTVDLRLPDYGPTGKLPRLDEVHRLCVSYWYGYPINNPQVVWWDNITLSTGPYIAPQVEITPLEKTVMQGETTTFSVRVLGGETPFSYTWYVNGTAQSETSNTFNFQTNTAGKYNITCAVTDNRGNIGSAIAWATVLSTPPEQPPTPPSLDIFKSEVRGAFMVQWLEDPHNWTQIVETCSDYGINLAVIETYLTHLYQNGQVVDIPELRTAINLFHDKGISVYILTCIGLTPPANNMKVEQGANRQTADWLCFTKNASREMLKAVSKSLAANYSIDGFIFDYIRWNFATDMCFCDECKAKFIADTGLSDVNWPTDVLSGGKYYWQFIEWRMKPVDEAVRDIVTWMKEENPNLLFGAAVFTAFDNCGNYWAMRIGQHTAEWVDKGYLDFVCPMLYSTDPTTNRNYLIDSFNFYTAGPEGKIPMIPFITDWNMDAAQPLAIEDFVETVRQMKLNGADGWIIWAYFGPGLYPQNLDIRTYLTALFDAGLMEPVWAIQNFTVSINGNYATISWTTTVPTNATIEYANGTIFYATIRYNDFGRPFHYKDIDYNSTDSIKITNSTWSTTHSFTIPITENTMFRIQSIDQNGIIVTSRPFTIST
jgi:hypothetical protein